MYDLSCFPIIFFLSLSVHMDRSEDNISYFVLDLNSLLSTLRTVRSKLEKRVSIDTTSFR